MHNTILMISNVTANLVNFRQELIEQLAKKHEVIIVAEENIGVDTIKKLGCRFINVEIERHGTNPIKELELVKKYRKLIQEINPKVVLTYTIKPNIYAGATCARLGIPYIANITGLGEAIENPGLLSLFSRKLYGFGLRKARKVFFQNQANCDYFIKNGIYKGEYEVLPGSGVNLEKHPYESYPTDTDPTILAVVGRVRKDKGIDEILDASTRLIGKKVIIRLIGNCEEDYIGKIKKAEESGVIEYVGRQENIHEWYKTCHAVLHASYHEGMSNVLLEAAASGRPILATDVPGCVETYVEGVTGFGFKPRDKEAIVSTIFKFLSLSMEERAQMGLNGRKRIEKYFSREIVVDKYQQIIDQLEGEIENETV